MCEFCMVDAKMGTKYALLTYSAHISSKYVTIMRLCIYTYILFLVCPKYYLICRFLCIMYKFCISIAKWVKRVTSPVY